MRSLRGAALLLVLVAAGCTDPAYKHERTAAKARLHLAGREMNWICVDGKPNRLYPNQSGYADIPAGARLTFWTRYVENRNSCDAHVSFVPVVGQKYRIAIDVQDSKCLTTVMKEDPSSRFGVAQDTTADHIPTYCNKP